MKRLKYAIFLISLLGCFGTLRASTLFVYPTPPDTMEHLQQRCDYIVDHFWDRCKFDYAMLHPDEFHAAFGNWIEIMPYATADTVHTAIDKLTQRFEKKAPEFTAISEMARHWLHDDTATYRSDELYLQFAKAAGANKKIDKNLRASYAADAKRLESSMIGATVPAVPVEMSDGSKGTFDDIKGKAILLIFDDAKDFDIRMARARFNSSPAVRNLVDSGELTIVDIYPYAADDTWRAHAAELPQSWVSVAMPQAEEYFEMRRKPQMYYLNSAHTVLLKDMEIDGLLDVLNYANQVLTTKNSNK